MAKEDAEGVGVTKFSGVAVFVRKPPHLCEPSRVPVRRPRVATSLVKLAARSRRLDALDRHLRRRALRRPGATRKVPHHRAVAPPRGRM